MKKDFQLEPKNRKITNIRHELVQIKHTEIPRGLSHEQKVWEVKDSLRKKIRRDRNADISSGRSLCPSRSSSRRSSRAKSGDGMELLVQEFIVRKLSC